MRILGLLILASTGLVPALWAAPAMQVTQADGKMMVRATAAKLAAWRPAPDTLVVVIPAESGELDIGALPSGVKAEKLAQGSLSGVVLTGVNGSWQVVQDGANWLIRPGAGLKAESVLMLRDGWRVGNEMLKPQTIRAAGQQWDVALMSSAKSVAGSVAGAVRATGNAAAVDTSVASVPVTKVEEIVKIPASVAAPMVAVPALKPAVSMEVGPSLRPVAQPLMAATALPTGKPLKGGVAPVASVAGLPSTGQHGAAMRAVSLSDMLARIEPAAGEVSAAGAPALPVSAGQGSGLNAMTGKAAVALASATAPQSGLAKVTIHAAPSMPAIGVSGVAAEVLPQILSDIYMPGTVVSLTTPDEHSANEHETPAMPSATEVTVAPSGSWNQTTLGPIEAALAAQKVSPTTEVSVVAVAPAPVHDEEPAQPLVSRILPERSGNYNDAVSDALQAIAVAPADSTRARDGAMNLAALYLAWQRPEEAIAVLDTLPIRADNLPASPQARLYMALAKLARGATPDAGLFDQGGQLANHAKLWKAVAASRAGDYATALKQWPQERGILPQYPAYLREQAQMAQASALVMVGDRSVAMGVIDQLVDGYKDPSEVPVGLTRLRGLARLGTPDEAKGLEYLAAAAEDMRDPTEAYRAKFQFVRALQQRRDLSDDQVRQYLSELWFDWRGDDLERDVLNNLAGLYDRAGDSRQALQYWQTLVRAYPKSPDLNSIAEHMTEAFLKVFDPENPKVYDTLAYLGLYYDFSELVPNDGRGDLVQEQVARLLVNANLWGRAVPILEQQLQYRPLDQAAQGRLVLLLADAYNNLGQAADGIKLLDKWQHVATTSTLARAWKIQEAQLMMKLNRPASSLKALASLPKDDSEARDLRIEATWAAQDWSSSVPLLQQRLASVPASQLISDTGAQLATFRLGYAYGQERDGEGLDVLTKRYSSSLSRLPQLADGVGAVAASSGVSASIVTGGPLSPLTGALNDINRLTDRIETVRDTLTAERKQQAEYNDKMRYMELLPPPAI